MSKNNSYNSKNIKNDKNAAKNIRDNRSDGLDSTNNNRTCIGRICNVQKNMFTILFEGREIPAKCRGSFYYDELEYPIVGLCRVRIPAVRREQDCQGVPKKKYVEATVSGRPQYEKFA